MGMRAVRLAEIRIFPVKGLRGGAHADAEVMPAGLAGDRRWMVVDENGRFLSQRERPGMARVQAQLTGQGVSLTADGAGELAVARPNAGDTRRDVVIWRDTVPAMDAGDGAAAWLTALLGVPCRLVFMADPAARQANLEFARPGDVVSFADGYPLLLTSRASLDDLNTKLANAVPMLRFRPNLVIEGALPWAEYDWVRLRIGQAVFRVVKPCDRCVVTTIDPETGLRPEPDEPLRTLKLFKRDARGRVLFGQNLVPERCGVVRVGDEVVAEEAVDSRSGAVVIG